MTTIVVWLISTQHVLAMMDENINNTMGQIGIQLSNRWDALSALLDIIKGCTVCEDQLLSTTIKARHPITAQDSAQDAAMQDKMLVQAFGRVTAIAEQHPPLKANQAYQKIMDNVNLYEGMIRQSWLTYNDSVTKLNRSIRIFPTSIAARGLGFLKRDYLEMRVQKSDIFPE